MTALTTSSVTTVAMSSISSGRLNATSCSATTRRASRALVGDGGSLTTMDFPFGDGTQLRAAGPSGTRPEVRPSRPSGTGLRLGVTVRTGSVCMDTAPAESPGCAAR